MMEVHFVVVAEVTKEFERDEEHGQIYGRIAKFVSTCGTPVKKVMQQFSDTDEWEGAFTMRLEKVTCLKCRRLLFYDKMLEEL